MADGTGMIRRVLQAEASSLVCSLCAAVTKGLLARDIFRIGQKHDK